MAPARVYCRQHQLCLAGCGCHSTTTSADKTSAVGPAVIAWKQLALEDGRGGGNGNLGIDERCKYSKVAADSPGAPLGLRWVGDRALGQTRVAHLAPSPTVRRAELLCGTSTVQLRLARRFMMPPPRIHALLSSFGSLRETLHPPTRRQPPVLAIDTWKLI